MLGDNKKPNLKLSWVDNNSKQEFVKLSLFLLLYVLKSHLSV